ncbi:MAG: hypothetical protein EOM19_03195 [Candidatus Moranbacteria bacterium]|nr:hypothetical protein [Candidatus Moranbacteria bacterium]
MAGEIHFFKQTDEDGENKNVSEEVSKEEMDQLRQTEEFFHLEGFVLGELFQLGVQEELSEEKEEQILEWMTCYNERNREKMAKVTTRCLKENKSVIDVYEKNSKEYNTVLISLAKKIAEELSFLEEERRLVA